MKRHEYVLITGGTSGFGYEFAKLFAEEGYNLILVARLEERLEEVGFEMKAYGDDVRTIAADLADPGAAEEIYSAVKNSGINVNILINNAGQGEWGNFVETDLDRQIDIINLNVITLVSLTYYFLRDMLARNEGRILQLGSVFSKVPAPLMSVYAATKAFVFSFSHSVIDEIKDTNVSMTVLLPGASDTDFFFKAGQEKSKIYRESDLSDPKDVVRDGYEALMSGKASVVSGAKNKMQSFMADIMPHTANAKMTRKQNEPSDEPEDEVRTHSDHEASIREREEIEKQNKR